MRSRTLKRPMFRMGGSSGTGITSGLDRPGYRNGPGPNMLDVAGRSLPGNALTSNLTNKISSEAKRSRGIGLGTLPGFLTSFGLNLATQSPRGNIFATAAEAAKDPFDTFQQAKFAEAKEEREFERERELQMLKNLDEDSRSVIMKQAEEGFEAGLYSSVNEGIRRLLQTKEFGVQFMPGEERKKAIENNAANISKNMRVNSLVANRMATFEYDFDSIQKKNDDLSFDIQNPYWDPNRKTYKEGFTYHDAISGKYFTRDSDAPATEGVPQGFVEIQINR